MSAVRHFFSMHRVSPNVFYKDIQTGMYVPAGPSRGISGLPGL